MEGIELTYLALLEKEGISLEKVGSKAVRKANEIEKIYNSKKMTGALSEYSMQKIEDLDEDICRLIGEYLVELEEEQPPAPPPPPDAPEPPAPPAENKGFNLRKMGRIKL